MNVTWTTVAHDLAVGVAGEVERSAITMDDLVERLYTVARTGCTDMAETLSPAPSTDEVTTVPAVRDVGRRFLRLYGLQVGTLGVALLMWMLFITEARTSPWPSAR